MFVENFPQGEMVESYQILKEVERNVPMDRTLEVLSVKAQVNSLDNHFYF